jgi:rhamnogalacturonan endolyase
VKDRYWNMWGLSHEGRVLWSYAGSVGHYPAIADVDEDGRDEVFVGFALVDHDGKVVFQKDAQGAHQDAAFIVKPPDGKWRLFFGNAGVHCLDPKGSELWHHPCGEAQHVVAGRFRSDSPLQVMAVDRTPVPSHRRDANAWAILYLYDLEGRELWRRQMEKGEWCIATRLIEWSGPGRPECVLVYGFSVEGQGPAKPARIYDGQGEVLDVLPLQVAPLPGETNFCSDCYGMAADVWGDRREEVILFGSRGFCVYANTRPLEKPSLYNMNLYPGM